MTRRLCFIVLCFLLQQAVVAAGWNVVLTKLIASARSQVGVTVSYDSQ